MPIRFACEHCDSTLSVSSRKAGHQVMCPKCRQPTPVPVPAQQPAAAVAEPQVAATRERPPPRAVEKPAPRPPQKPSPPVVIAPPPVEPQPALETFVPPPEPVAPAPAPEPEPAAPEDAAAAPEREPEESGDDEVTWVYEGSVSRHPAAYDQGEIDFNRISLPRYVLYGQGILLIAVAMLSLTLGILIGRGTAPGEVEQSGAPQPSYLTGIVTYKSSSGASLPDRGAVVIVVPQDRRPDDKAPVEGLRPSDPEPDADQPAIAGIKSIGGDYMRADEQGYFKLRVPDTGNYFLLVVSRHAERKAGERLDPVHLAQMGRYFIPAPDLLGDRQYRWRSETIKRDKEYKFSFQ